MSRYIDADELYVDWYDSFVADDGTVYDNFPLISKEQIDDAPSIDIVRCQDCKHWVYNFNGCARNPCTEPWYATDFCNYGEKK